MIHAILLAISGLSFGASLPRHPLFHPPAQVGFPGENTQPLPEGESTVAFDRASGHLLPEEAKSIGIAVSGTDTIQVEVRAIPALAFGRAYDEDDVDSVKHYPLVHRERIVRPKDSLVGNWTAKLDLERLSRQSKGAFLNVKVFSWPSAFRPRVPSTDCDTVWARRVVLVSSLGMFGTRISDSILEVSAVHLDKGTPWSGVEVLGLGENGRERCRGVSDQNGWVRLRGDSIAFVVASGGGQQAMMGPLSLGWRSRWEGWEERNAQIIPTIRGASSSASPLPEGLRLFPYVLRGVHRPGDSVIVGCLVRGNGGTIPVGRRLEWTLENPRGRRSDSMVQIVGKEGHCQWRLKLPDRAPTGSWQIRSEIGEASESVRFSVEVEARRAVRVDAEFKEDTASVESALMGQVHAVWQTGRIAHNLPVRWKFKFRGGAGNVVPDGYSGQVPRRLEGGSGVRCDTAFDTLLDAAGMDKFRLPVPELLKQVSMGSVEAEVAVFPPGAEGVRRTLGSIFIRWGRSVGLKVRSSDSIAIVEAAVFDRKRNRIPDRLLRLVLRKDSSTVVLDTLLRSGDSLRIPARRLRRYAKDTLRSQWFGLEVCEKGDSTRCVVEDLATENVALGKRRHKWGFAERKIAPVHIPVPDTTTEEQERQQRVDSALVVQAEAEDTAIQTGQPVSLSWESTRSSLALVQIVQGDRLLSQEWMPCHRGLNVWEKPADPRWDPEVTVVVSELVSRIPGAPGEMLRQAGKAFQVRNPDREWKLGLEASGNFHPLGSNPIFVRNVSARTGSVVVSAIDRGILDLDNFRPGNPLEMLNREDGVPATWWDGLGHWKSCYLCQQGESCDLSDEAVRSRNGSMGGFGSGSSGRSALGAGGTGRGMSTRGYGAAGFHMKQEARPMAWVSPVLKLPAEGLTVQIPVPAYTGAVTITAIGASGHSVGMTETTVFVSSPLELSLALPRTLAPGDTSQLSLVLYGGTPGPAMLRIVTVGPLRVIGDTDRTVTFDTTREARLDVPVVALQRAGEAWIEAQLEQGKERMHQPVGVVVGDERRFAERIVTQTSRDGNLALVPTSRFLPGTVESHLEVGVNVLPGMDRRLRELIRYPHGCLEQTTSAAWPQLYLDDLLPDLDSTRAEEAHRNVEAAIARLIEFKTSSGLLSLWPGSDQPYVWGTLWAAGFLQAAHSKGYNLPLGMLDGVKDALKRLPPYSLSELENIERIALLSGREKFDSLELDSLSRRPLPDVSRWILATARARNGDTAGASFEAAKAGQKVSPLREWEGTLSTPLRDKALILSAMVELGATAGRDTLVEAVRDRVSEASWLSTQELAASLAALAVADPRPRGPVVRDSSLWWKGPMGAWKRLALRGGRAVVALAADQDTIRLKWEGKGRVVGAQVARSGILMDTTSSRDSGLGISLSWTLDGKAGPLPAALPQRTEFVCHAKIRNLLDRRVPNAAFTLWLPSGWEVRNDRLDKLREGKSSAAGDYRDIRDDRVVEYFDLKPKEEREVVLPIQAVQAGSYQGPEAVVEALYDEHIRARVRSPRVRVESAGARAR